MKEKHNTNGMTREEYVEEIRYIYDEMKYLVEKSANPTNDIFRFQDIKNEGEGILDRCERTLFSAELWDTLFGGSNVSRDLKSEVVMEVMEARKFFNEFFNPTLNRVDKLYGDYESLINFARQAND